jgi:hypothetical protein
MEKINLAFFHHSHPTFLRGNVTTKPTGGGECVWMVAPSKHTPYPAWLGSYEEITKLRNRQIGAGHQFIIFAIEKFTHKR